MKKVSIVFRPDKLEELKDVLNKLGVKGMTVSTVLGCGNQKGIKEIYRGTTIDVKLLHKLKVEVVVNDDLVETLITKTRDAIATGKIGDGKIFISSMEEVVRIRTGERGEAAI
jgi:nitrogen regulatory protein PII